MTSLDKVKRLQELMNTQTNADIFVKQKNDTPIEMNVKTAPKVEGSQTLFQATISISTRFENRYFHSVDGSSQACLTPEQAQNDAAQCLLLNMSKSSIFTESFRKTCQRLYVMGYKRGKELCIGDVYPFAPNVFLDLKKDSAIVGPWSYAAFEKSFGAYTCKTIAAFINTRIMMRKRPFGPCRIVFGVDNSTSRQVQGITLHKDASTSKISDELLRKVRDGFESWSLSISNEYKAYCTRIGNSVHIHIDEIAARPFAKSYAESRQVLITVLFPMNEENDFIFPCMFKAQPNQLISERHRAETCKKERPEVAEIPYRRSNPEGIWASVPLTYSGKDEVSKLFVLGVPSSFVLPENSDNINS